MAISEIAGSAASNVLSASQASGAQRATQQTLQATTQAGDQAGGDASADTSITGAAQSVSAGGEGSSSGDATRGTRLDVTV